jgi:release factor glutamine methyltransferase
MLSYSQAFYQLKDRLQPLYDADEAVAVSHLFLEFITGLNKSDRLLKKDVLFTDRQQEQFDSKSKQLTKGKPIQYVTNSAWFMGREFLVNESVLIPRPETEELVQWIVDEVVSRKSLVVSPGEIDVADKLRVLDIGAGSGCIGLSLARLLPNAVVTCADVSKEAIEVLKTNIEWVLTSNEKKKGMDNITLKTLDFLNETQRNKQLGRYELIVSNPPYIPASEKVNMHKNVKDYEPSIALFVPDSDALVFYRAIASFGKDHLSDNGYIYCELDAEHADACKALFEEQGYQDVEIKKDMHGNWRMLRAS